MLYVAAVSCHLVRVLIICAELSPEILWSIRDPVTIVIRLIVSCIPSLWGKLLSQQITLYTILTKSLCRYFSKCSSIAIACTLSFTVKIYHSIAGTCSSLHVVLIFILMPTIAHSMCSNCPSPMMCFTLKPCPWYICTTCYIDVAIVAAFSILMSSAVPKCMPHDTVTTKGTLLMYMMYNLSVTLLCDSTIQAGRTSMVVMTCSAFFLLFFLLMLQNCPKNIFYLYDVCFCDITVWALVSYYVFKKSLVLGLPLMSWKDH